MFVCTTIFLRSVVCVYIGTIVYTLLLCTYVYRYYSIFLLLCRCVYSTFDCITVRIYGYVSLSIASFGLGCRLAKYPGVHARVSWAEEWSKVITCNELSSQKSSWCVTDCLLIFGSSLTAAKLARYQRGVHPSWIEIAPTIKE